MPPKKSKLSLDDEDEVDNSPKTKTANLDAKGSGEKQPAKTAAPPTRAKKSKLNLYDEDDEPLVPVKKPVQKANASNAKQKSSENGLGENDKSSVKPANRDESNKPDEASKKTKKKDSGEDANAASKNFNAKKMIEDLQGGDMRTRLVALTSISSVKNVNVIPREVIIEIGNILKLGEKKLLVIASLASLNYLASFDRTRNMIGDVGIIQQLIPFLSSFEDIIRQRALEVILALCASPKNQIRLVEPVVVESITMVRVGEGEDFSYVEEVTKTLQPPQIMLPIISLIQRDEGQSALAFQIVEILFGSQTCLDMVTQDESFMEAFVVLVDSHTQATRIWAVQQCEKLAIGFPNFIHALCGFNLIEPLIRLLHDEQTRMHAINTLIHVSKLRDHYRLWIGDQGGIESLLEIINLLVTTITKRSYIQMAQQDYVQSDQTKHDPNQAALQALVTLLSLITEEISGKDSGFLSSNKERVVVSHGIKVLLLLFTSSKVSDDETGEALREQTVRIISNISRQENTDNTLKILDGGLLNVLLEMLIEESKLLEKKQVIEKRSKKQNIVKAISAFAMYNDCVKKLIEQGIVEKLLDMIRQRLPITSTVGEIFAQMNTHTNFQRELFESNGLQVLIDLVKTGRHEFNEPVSGLRALSPFAKTPNGRLVLKLEGVFQLVKAIDEEEKLQRKLEKQRLVKERKEREEKERQRQLELQRQQREQKFMRNVKTPQGRAQPVVSQAPPWMKFQQQKREEEERKKKQQEIKEEEEEESSDSEDEDFDEEKRKNKSKERHKDKPVGYLEYLDTAKQLYKKLLSEHDASKRLPGLKARPFEFDYDLLEKVDKEFVTTTYKRICDVLELKPQHLKFQVNWRFLERIKEDDPSPNEGTSPVPKPQGSPVPKPQGSPVPKPSPAPNQQTPIPDHGNTCEKTNNNPEEDAVYYKHAKKSTAVQLLCREALWNELVTGLELLAKVGGEKVNHAFKTQVKLLVVDMTEGPAYFEYEDLLLKYHVSMEGVLAPPKAIASSLSESLFGEDITLFADIEETDEQYELAIEALKKSAQDSRIAMIGDVNILYFHLEMNADEMYQPGSLSESQSLIACKEVLNKEELFIKAWPIVKLNKNGMEQERILVLTDQAYYTVTFDFKQKKIDFGHCKYHSFNDYVLTDVGLLRSKEYLEQKKKDIEKLKQKYMELKQMQMIQSQQKDKKDDQPLNMQSFQQELAQNQNLRLGGFLDRRKSGHQKIINVQIEFDGVGFEQWLHDNPSELENMASNMAEKNYALNIVTREEAHDVKSSVDFDDSDNRKSRKLDLSLDEEASGNSSNASELGFDAETQEAVQSALAAKSTRPNTSNMYNSVFIAPHSLPRSKHKPFLGEIAWSFHGAISAYRREAPLEPFETDIIKPQAGVMGKLYNLLNFGYSSK